MEFYLLVHDMFGQEVERYELPPQSLTPVFGQADKSLQYFHYQPNPAGPVFTIDKLNVDMVGDMTEFELFRFNLEAARQFDYTVRHYHTGCGMIDVVIPATNHIFRDIPLKWVEGADWWDYCQPDGCFNRLSREETLKLEVLVAEILGVKFNAAGL